ncbi:DEAD/DEAH box helicase family protein [Nocardia wallacei]|uniref:DEAD/DEAH box helicase family protein n=1 Tax=Nocardia wallacei TaxID=480035 RepID=UPI003CC7C6CC
MELEAVTRKDRIDPKLKAAKWTVTPYDSVFASSPPPASAVEEWPTANGPADYALIDGGAVRGVVEAKKVTIGPQGVLTQAQRYSRGVDGPRIRGEFGVPFLYSTNGEQVHFHDVRRARNRSRQVSGFHTPKALTEMLRRDLDAELAALSQVPFNQRLHDYQVEANQAVEKAIAAGRRKMLLAMATGTGKTLMTVSEVYRLMKT